MGSEVASVFALSVESEPDPSTGSFVALVTTSVSDVVDSFVAGLTDSSVAGGGGVSSSAKTGAVLIRDNNKTIITVIERMDGRRFNFIHYPETDCNSSQVKVLSFYLNGTLQYR